MWRQIISDTIKHYWEKIGFVPTDEIKAFIVYHSNLSVEEKHLAYKRLFKSMTDETVIVQLTDIMDNERFQLERFIENPGGEIYAAHVYEDGDKNGLRDTTYFTTYEKALRYAKVYVDEFRKDFEKRGCYYELVKLKVCDFFVNDTLEFDGDEGHIIFRLDGSIDHISCPDTEIMRKYEAVELFSEKYYEIPHPFERGDILVRKSGRLAIQDRNVEEGLYYILITQGFGQCHADYSDMGASVDCFDPRCGRLLDVDEPMSVLSLDHAGIDVDDWKPDDPAFIALSSISRMLKGKSGTLQFIQDACRCLRERNEEANKIDCYCQKYGIRQPYYGWEPV